MHIQMRSRARAFHDENEFYVLHFVCSVGRLDARSISCAFQYSILSLWLRDCLLLFVLLLLRAQTLFFAPFLLAIAFHLLFFWMGNHMPFFITLLHQSARMHRPAHVRMKPLQFFNGDVLVVVSLSLFLSRKINQRIAFRINLSEIKTDFVCVCIIFSVDFFSFYIVDALGNFSCF